MRTGADELVRALETNGVRHIFGMPGSHSTAIYDAILRNGAIHTILTRNEQAGAYAADGYARVTGQPGIICTTAGPGATNALSGIAEAYSDSIPVLLITGQVNSDRMHLECGAYHELDLESIFRPCTRFVTTIRNNPDIQSAVDHAFAAMMKARPGPAALILPQDLMAAAARDPAASSWSMPYVSAPDPAAISHAVRLLTTHRKPLILAGGGAIWGEAAEPIQELARRLDCPVLTTLNGKGILDERDRYSLGHARTVRAKHLLPHADVMVAIGCRFTEVLTWFGTMPVPRNLIQIDVAAEQIGMNYPVAVGIHSHAKPALESLLAKLPTDAHADWGPLWEEARSMPQPKPEWFIETLRNELPEDAIVFTDASEMALRMQTDYPVYAPRQFFYPSTYISLGYGFPAAVGGAVGSPSKWVVSVSGDGGFLMTAQELATAARYGLNLIAIIHNDSAYGAIKNLQRIKHASRFLDTDLNNPNFVRFAEAFGIPATSVADAPAFAKALRGALNRSGPSVIEVKDQWRSLRLDPLPSVK